MSSKLWIAILMSMLMSACAILLPNRQTSSIKQAEILLLARNDFNNAMTGWNLTRKGFSGTLIYYYGAEGPLLREFYQLMETGEGRGPEEWHVECVRCVDDSNCQITARMTFRGEEQETWRDFDLVRDGFFSPVADREISLTAARQADVKSCKAENQSAFARWRRDRDTKIPPMDSEELREEVLDKFETTLIDYRDGKWRKLSKPYLEFPLRPYLERADVYNTKERLLGSGELPARWRVTCAYLKAPGSYRILGDLAHQRDPNVFHP